MTDRREPLLIGLAEFTIEAAWLAALLLVPLAFWPLSDSAGNPFKAALLEVLFAVAAAAWFTKLVAGGRPWRPMSSPESRRWIWLTMTVVVAQALALTAATLMSLNDTLSWHGPFADGWGVRHQLELMAFFLLVLGHLRDRVQIERTLGVIILGSAPIALYAILQNFGFDPLSWLGQVDEPLNSPRLRTMASMGNPTLLGAYLLCPIFVTIGVLSQTLKDARLPEVAVRFSWRHLGLIFVLLIQGTALLLTSSRAPFFALLAGLGLLFAGWLATRPLRRLWRLALLAVLIGSVVVAVSSSQSQARAGDPLPPGMARLANVDLEGTTVSVRRKIWRESLALSNATAPVLSSQGNDPHLRWRLAVGYGPHAAELPLPSRGRAHNRLLEALLTSGWIGLLAEIALYALVLAQVLRWFGSASQRRTLFWALILTLAAIGAARLSVLAGYPELVVVAGTGGALLALLGIMIGSGAHPSDTADPATHELAWLRLALLVTLCAHFVNQSFSDDYLVLRLLFWLVLAMILMTLDARPISLEAPTTKRRTNIVLFDGPLGVLCCAVLGLWLLVGFAVPRGGISTGLGLLGTLPWQAWWLFGGTLLTTVVLSGPTWGRLRRKQLVTLGLVVVAATAYLATLPRLVKIGAPDTMLRGPSMLVTSVIAMMLLSLLCLVVALEDGKDEVAPSAQANPAQRTRWRSALAIGLGAVLALALLQAPWTSLLAHDLAGEAKRLERSGHNRVAARFGQEAARVAPHSSHLKSFAGRLALDAAKVEPDGALRLDLLAEAEGSLSNAMAQSPFDSDHVVNLSRYRVHRAVLEPTRKIQTEQLKASIELYETALRMRPRLPEVWLELAGVHLRLDNRDAARAALERGLLVLPEDPELLGRLTEMNRRRNSPDAGSPTDPPGGE